MWRFPKLGVPPMLGTPPMCMTSLLAGMMHFHHGMMTFIDFQAEMETWQTLGKSGNGKSNPLKHT